MMVKHLLPPRLRDWKKGVPQVGIFIRTAKGSIIEMVRDRATADDSRPHHETAQDHGSLA
jgi:hypothetical protein